MLKKEVIWLSNPRGRDRMVVGFTTYAINAYHHVF
jgi:hypothetical protein